MQEERGLEQNIEGGSLGEGLGLGDLV